jgi:hypothetical protein
MAASDSDEEVLFTIDHLITQRAKEAVQKPLSAFPKRRDVSQWEEFTGGDLDRFIGKAAKYMTRSALEPVVRSFALDSDKHGPNTSHSQRSR